MTELALVAKATVILGVALGATRIARNARASLRSLILAAAFGLVLILPLASAVVPPRELPIPDAYAPAFLHEELNRPATVAAGPVRLPDAARPHWRGPSAASLTRAAWLLGALATMAPVLIGLWRVRGLRNHSRHWAEGRKSADALRASLGVRRVVAVVVHGELSAPMTCGWLRPAIVMPADAPNWPAAEIRQALVHELEHVRRHDWPVHVIARIVCALYWFHPAAWIAWRRLRLESERACDDAVVAHGEDVAYAQQLVALARRFGTVTAPLLSMADRRTLATRVAAILNRDVARGRVGGGCAAAIVFAAAGLSAVVSPLQARPQPQPITPTRPQAALPTPGGLQFDAASIRRRTDPGGGFMGVRPGGRFTAEGVSLQDLLVFSYLVQPYQIVDGPDWLDVERWDVNATGATGTRNDVLLAVQRLLADRFSLVIRRGVRELPIYALVVARSDGRLGPQLQRSAVDCAAMRAEAQKTGVIPPDAPRLCVAEGRLGSIRIGGAPLADLAPMLSTRVQRTVVDRTGLKGTWDLTLTYAPDPAQIPPGPLFPGVSFDPNGPALFTAIQEQLGLKLEAARAPVEVLVVEQAQFAREN